jgi:hypothetical protein
VSSLSQLPNPAAQAPSTHAPLTQLPWAFGNAHAVTQLPQCVSSVLRFVSQPLPTFASQLPQPAAQLMEHEPPVHWGVPLVELQITPQAPQLVTLVCVSASHPVAYCRSQFAYGAVQAATVQVVVLQPGVPFCTVQALPQAPQLLTLLTVEVSQPSAAEPLQLP